MRLHTILAFAGLAVALPTLLPPLPRDARGSVARRDTSWAVADRSWSKRDESPDGTRVTRDEDPDGTRVTRDESPDGTRVTRDEDPDGTRVTRDESPDGTRVTRV